MAELGLHYNVQAPLRASSALHAAALTSRVEPMKNCKVMDTCDDAAVLFMASCTLRHCCQFHYCLDENVPNFA